MLTLEFTPPAGGTGACCAPAGGCGVVLEPGTACSSPDVYQGLGSVCVPNTCPQPTGACGIPDASATCNQVIAADCSTAGGTYQGNGSSCGAADCPVPDGPLPDGWSGSELPWLPCPLGGSARSLAERIRPSFVAR